MNNSTTLWYENPAKNFNEALPLGSGRMGAMFYGDPVRERISLNEDTLWSGYPRRSQMHCADTYREIRELVLQDKTQEAEERIETAFEDFLVQQYLPLGDLHLQCYHDGPVSDYRRSLQLDSALGQVSYQAGDCRFYREYLISREYNVLAVHITCDRPDKISFDLSLTGKMKCCAYAQTNALYLEGNCPVALADYGDFYQDVTHHRYFDEDAKKGVGYRAGVTVQTVGGTVQEETGLLQVRNADSAVVYFAVRTSFNGPGKHPVLEGKPYRTECDADLQRAMAEGFRAIRETAEAQHREQFGRTGLTLTDGRNSHLPTDKRLLCHPAEEDPSLYVLLFNFGKYLTLAASQEGTRATNLQGIWNEKILPPWSSNYTLNINTEMNYWPTLQLGLPECYRPLIELVKTLHKNGQSTAGDFYGVKGFVSHHATDVWGLSHPTGSRLKDSAKWCFWNLSSGWLCRMLYSYYEYTQDEAFLRSVAPVLADCALFYRELLVEQDGKLMLCPSTSPENTYLENGRKTAVDKTTAMTMQILQDVFRCHIAAGKRLGMDVSEYEGLLPRLYTDFLDEAEGIREWYGQRQQWESDHRHLSHLYGLFPGSLFNEQEKQGAKTVLLARGDNGTGWSLAWKINLWARLGDGEKAKALLNRQLQTVSSDIDDASCTGGSYPNLFCAHPPFQIDGNFGACSGIIQMLLQVDEAGEPVFLPALPESWQSGRVENFRIPGNRAVSFGWENGRLTDSRITELGE